MSFKPRQHAPFPPHTYLLYPFPLSLFLCCSLPSFLSLYPSHFWYLSHLNGTTGELDALHGSPSLTLGLLPLTASSPPPPGVCDSLTLVCEHTPQVLVGWIILEQGKGQGVYNGCGGETMTTTIVLIISLPVIVCHPFHTVRPFGSVMDVCHVLQILCQLTQFSSFSFFSTVYLHSLSLSFFPSCQLFAVTLCPPLCHS